MKIITNIIILSLLSFVNSISGNSLDEKMLFSKLESNSDKDTLGNEIKSWPECPQITSISISKLNKYESIISWKSTRSERIEFEIQIVDEISKSLINRKVTSKNSVLIDQRKIDQVIEVQIRSVCYTENRTEPIYSDWWVTTYNQLQSSPVNFCDDFVTFMDIGESFGAYDVGFQNVPQGVILTADVCYVDGGVQNCNTITSAGPNDSTVFVSEEGVEFQNIQVTTNSGTTNCYDQELYVPDPINPGGSCAAFSAGLNMTFNTTVVNGVESTIFNFANNGLDSWCNNVFLDVVVVPPNGNSITFNNPTGNTISGCGIFQVNANYGHPECSCSFEFEVECNDPPPPPPPPPGDDDGPSCEEDITVEISGLQNQYSSLYQTGDLCMVQFESSFDMSNEIEIIQDGGELMTSDSDNDSGMMVVPSGTTINISNTIAYTDSNGNPQELVCEQTIEIDCNGTNDPPENDTTLCSAVQIEFDENNCNNFTWSVTPDSLDVFMVHSINGGSPTSDMNDANGNNNSANADYIEYYIYSEGEEGNSVVTSCQVNVECDMPGDPDNDDEDDDNNDDDDILCDYFQVDVDSSSYYPSWQISWTSVNIPDLEIDMIINGQSEYISGEQNGTQLISPGDQVTMQVILNSGNISSDCTFDIDYPEEDPEDPIEEDVICSYFNLLQGEELNSNELTLTIAGGNETLINAVLQQNGSDMDELESFLSQIASIELTLDYFNDDNPLGGTINETLYTNPNGNSYNGEFSLYFDPIDWAKNIGLGTGNLDALFTITITDIDGNVFDCGQNELPIIFLDDEEEDEDEEDFGLDCDSDPDTTIQTTTLYDGDISGEILTFKGFPFVVDAATPSSGGTYTGTGFIAVPFGGGKKVSISFPSITVNEELQVIDGQIVANSNSPGNYPAFDLPSVPINIGGDICVESPPPSGYDGDGFNNETGLNDYGFRADSTHVLTNSLWDPNGFNLNGIHKDTGTEYNEDGCNRDGIDEEGKPCDPSGDDEALNEFIDSVQTELPLVIDTIVKDIVEEIIDSLNNLDCSQFRTTVNNKITQLGYSREFIVGQDEEYIDEGLSDKFASEPQVLVTSIYGRNEDTKLLEENHVELYKCDKEKTNLTKLRDALQAICNDPSNTEFVDHINLLMADWGSYDKERYLDDPVAFREWMEYAISEYIENTIKPKNGITYLESPINIFNDLNSIFDFNSDPSSIASAMASTEHIFFESDQMDDIDFDYRQGMEYINGVHRMYFVEQLAKLNSSINGGSALELPITIEKQVGSFVYSIYIDNMVFDYQARDHFRCLLYT